MTKAAIGTQGYIQLKEVLADINDIYGIEIEPQTGSFPDFVRFHFSDWVNKKEIFIPVKDNYILSPEFLLVLFNQYLTDATIFEIANPKDIIGEYCIFTCDLPISEVKIHKATWKFKYGFNSFAEMNVVLNELITNSAINSYYLVNTPRSNNIFLTVCEPNQENKRSITLH